ncbi:MAG: Vitamin B12 dependent methionine synthase activation subunit [Clostridia bacterium]|nr:Vitamin B12 dependent methionine synthase activation subunit [Clostridia bacterium]
MYTVYTKQYDSPPVDRREILRYAGIRGEVSELEILLDDCLLETLNKLSYRVCFCQFPLREEGDALDLGFAVTESRDLKRHLAGCHHTVVFAATVGMELDRLIARYGYTSPLRALMLQAIGAERIEALCDRFCEELQEEMKERGWKIGSRFSPGYGDLPLETQSVLFQVLDCPRKIGLTLNASLLMSPSKSVTALMGVSNEK